MSGQQVVRIMVALLVSGTIAGSGAAQEIPPETEPTRKQTAASVPADDSGADSEKKAKSDKKAGGPDVTTWKGLLEYWLTPRPVPKQNIVRIDEKYAYPHIAVGFKMEIVRETEDTVWLVGLPPEDPRSALHRIWLQRQVDEADTIYRAEAFSEPGAVFFMDFEAEPVPPPFMDSLDFERAGANLPDTGRWQMGFAVADMNEDGHPDLVFPPQRKAFPPRPSIFLGDGAGGFQTWSGIEWPPVPFDYGGVAVADFNGDGHQDIVIAVHFKGQYVIYGDGAGHFLKAETLPTRDPRITSRAVAAADFDDDGRPDLAFLAEVDFDRQTSSMIPGVATAWVLLNRGGSWEIVTEGLPRNHIGDVIRTRDMDGDGQTDIVFSSSSLNRRQFVYLNQDGTEWRPSEHRGALSAAYHFDVEPGDGEVFATFIQFRLVDGKNQSMNGLIRYPMTDGDEDFVQGQPVVWNRERADVFFRIALGDLNGDGRVDVVAGRKGSGLEVYIQSDAGDFYLEDGPEFEGIGRVFDIRLLDVNADGRADIIASGTPHGDDPGGVWVWLNRPKE